MGALGGVVTAVRVRDLTRLDVTRLSEPTVLAESTVMRTVGEHARVALRAGCRGRGRACDDMEVDRSEASVATDELAYDGESARTVPVGGVLVVVRVTQT